MGVGSIQQFFTDYKDLLGVAFGSGLLLAGSKLVWWWLQQRRKRQIPPTAFPFDVIKPRSGDALKRLLGGDDDDPLADRNIPYQDRVAGKSVRRDLERLLVKAEKHHWVIILGGTGLGKTREAAQLAASLNPEWTILKFTGDGWLDQPTAFPIKEIGSDRKLLFFLDNLNRHTATGKKELSPKAADDPLCPRTESFQSRLLRTLEFYEGCCGRENVWVIATARNETTPDHVGEPSAWDKLEWEKHPNLWSKFICQDLAEPEERAIVQTLQDTVDPAGIAANPNDFPDFARRNDRTFRNIVENLRDLKREGEALTPDTFLPRLQDTWEKRYRRIVQKYPVAAFIYDAVEMLHMGGIVLAAWTIAPTAQMIIARQNHWLWLWHYWQIPMVVRLLIREQHIDNPQDGQIEAKKTTLGGVNYIPPLQRLVLQLAKQRPREMLKSLEYFGTLLTEVGVAQHGLKLLEQAVAIKPDYYNAWNNRGVALTKLGRYEEAIACFKQAVKIKPDLYEAWNNQGYALYKLGRYEEALGSYDQAVKIQPDMHEAWYIQGLALALLKRYEEAIASYDQAVKIKPDLHQAWYKRGWILFTLKRYEEAIISYDRVVAVKPDNDEAWNSRGLGLFALGRYEEAILSYDQALEINPDNDHVWNNRGNTLAILRQYEEAINSFRRALEINPDYYNAWNNRGKVLSILGQYEEAIDSYDHAMKITPKYYSGWLSRGKALHALGRYEEAVASYDRAVKVKPDLHEAWINWGNALYALGRYEAAVAIFKQAVEIEPDVHEAWYSLGLTLDFLKRYEEAIISYDQAVKINPKYHVAWYYRGNALYNLERYEEAIISYDRALEIKPEYHEAYYNRGAVLYELERYEEAIDNYDRAVAIQPDLHTAWYYKGNALHDLGRYEEAIISYDQTVKIQPEYHEAWNMRGLAMSALGHYEEAIVSYNTALQFASNEGLIFYNKACCYSLQGKVEQTIAMLQRARELNYENLRESIEADADFDSIRDDERFQVWLKNLGEV